MKEKIFWKMMGESFKIVAEQEFNPDFVISWALDSFDTGLIIGCAAGSFLASMTVTTIGLYFLKNERRKKMSEIIGIPVRPNVKMWPLTIDKDGDLVIENKPCVIRDSEYPDIALYIHHFSFAGAVVISYGNEYFMLRDCDVINERIDMPSGYDAKRRTV